MTDRPSRALPCHDRPDLWFSVEPAEVEEAKELCLRCPQQRTCLAAAVERREPWGVWGGHLLDHGRITPRKRPRGRPRKADAAV